MAKIRAFLSYDHRDRNLALGVSARFLGLNFSKANRAPLLSLRWNKYAIDTWIDTGNIPLGSDWRQEITKGITSCHVFVLIANSAHYSSYVSEEVRIALSQYKPILPLYADAPAALAQYQVSNLQGYHIPDDDWDSPGSEAFERTIIAALDNLPVVLL